MLFFFVIPRSTAVMGHPRSLCLIRRLGICEVSELKDNSKCCQLKMKRYLRQPGFFSGGGGVLKKKKGHSRCVEAQRWEGHSGPVSKFWRQGGIATKRAVTGLSHMPLSPVGLRRSRQRRAAYGLGSLPPVWLGILSSSPSCNAVLLLRFSLSFFLWHFCIGKRKHHTGHPLSVTNMT